MNESYDIIWNHHCVGQITNAIPDAWYLEGNWVSNNSPGSLEFEKLVSGFDPKVIYKDPTKGAKIILKANGCETPGLVYSLENEQLFLRRVFSAEAINWLQAT